MATTIQQAFQQLKANLEITGLQSSTVSTRQTRIREVMDDGMDVLDSFLTGSYARSTMIAPHGYLRVTVTRKKITLDYVAVPDPSENAKDAFLKPYDTVEVAV